MRPYSYHSELRQQVTEQRPAAGGSWIAQPEIAAVVGDVIGTAGTAVTVFLSVAAVISPLAVRANPPWPAGDVLLAAGAFTGGVLLLKSLAMARPLLFWLEVLTDRDLNQDGDIGQPMEETDWRVLPTSSEGQVMYGNAVRLWHYTYNQLRWAQEEGKTVKGKPWARRTAATAVPTITEENWPDVIDVWVAGGLLLTRDAGKVEAEHYRQGLEMLNGGMAALGFVRINKEWVRR